MNLHTSTMELIEKLTYFNLTYHVEKDHSLGHKKNNIKCYECGQYGHKKDQCKKGKTEQGESSSYYRRGNEQDEVRSSKNKTVNHIVRLEDVVINNMKRLESEDELFKMLNQFTIGIRIEDYIYEALIDTGAEIFILLNGGIKIEKMISCNKKIKGYADGEIVLCETCRLNDENYNLLGVRVFNHTYRFLRIPQGGRCTQIQFQKVANQVINDLRYKVSKEGVRISDENKNLFLNRKTPTHKGKLVSLLASSNYFRSSIPNYENLTAELYNLANSVTDKKDKINFDEENLCALKSLNEAMSNLK
uniref:CCHC-type domain-containing protein n=1 Tax=Strongyloides venezuelensis TaxID=75913 RepID=A0A0K0FJ64_STRVS